MKTLFRKVLVGPHRCTVDASLLKIAPLVREVDIKPVLIEVQTAYGDQNDPFVHETFNNHLISSWRVAYKSGATARAMAKVFNTLPCGKAFSIHIWNYIDLFPDIGYPGGAEIYALAFESFTRGNIRPSELNILIGSDSDCGPTWQCSDRVWNSLNFDNLRRLCFVGSAAEISSGGLHGPDLPALLSKSAASLHEVVFDVSGLSLFRGPGPFAMPALRRLSIVHTQIKFPEFSDWISQCAVLQELSITYSEVFDFENPVAGATSSSFTMWRPLFTCVRTHPSRMQLNFNPLVVETCLHDNEDDENPIRKEMRFIYVNHNTIEACHEKSFKESDNDKLNKKLEAVINYVSNAGEWTLNEMD
ncbi:hypothetical protein HII31_00297 [Pseudocercospora fuligena]|uniref:F-box domain-containing protein n=1 Tax=Pseudocercospora fuligena TaxID=685502 RepID=A0A8H6RW82_9PEZI|nr:hypothetical protein HII31_00297 [Pseudocercospora fuligena]